MANNNKNGNYNIILILLAIIFFPITILYFISKLLPEPDNKQKVVNNDDDIDWETECEICGEQEEDCECDK